MRGFIPESSRVLELKSRKVKKYPVSIRLPKEFIRSNRLKIGDTLEIYLVENTYELIIKKVEGL